MSDQPPKKLNLNVEQNSASLSITPAIYIRILRKAVEQTLPDLKRLESALPVNDFTVIKALTHRFKGDFDNLRITELSSLARQMNDIAKKEEGNDRILDLLNEFIAYFEQLQKTVEQAGS